MSSVNGPRRGPRDERTEVRPAAQPRAKVASERPDVRARGADDVDDRDWPGRIGAVPLDEIERLDVTLRAGSSTASPARAIA